MNKALAMMAGGAVGGVIGYLVADYLAYYLMEKAAEVDFELDELDGLEQQVGGMDQELYEFEESKNDQTNYAKKVIIDEKPSLEELTRPYRGEEEEKEPYVMSLEEWEETMNAFERHTILYYEMDGVYADDQEAIIDDPTNMFVPNAFLHFGEGSEDEDVVYICNPHRSEMYEILRMKASYQVDVLGEIPPEEPEKKGRTRKPRGSHSGSKTEKEIEELGGADNGDSESD